MAMKPLFELLPALHRLRDAAQGDQLRTLLNLVTREVRLLEDDIARLYDNWFIETCEEWVVPYIADLLGVKGLPGPSSPDIPAAFTQRGFVANTLAYRRRKGTSAVLEQLARDLTGWRCKVVEYFERTTTVQHVNHPRAAHAFAANIRSTWANQFHDTPFDQASHLADVRHIDVRRGRHNAPHVGLFLWRVQSYLLEDVTAREVDGLRFTLNPLGRDAPLFNVPQTEDDIAQPSDPVHVPMPITRYDLHRDLALFYGDATSARSLRLVTGGVVRPAAEVRAGFLDDTATGWAHTALPGQVVIDPELGRVAFDAPPPAPVTASFAYGFGGDLGGGPYDRRASVQAFLQAGVGWQMGVFHEPPPDQSTIVSTLAAAVQEWNQQPAGTQGVIALMDSRSHDEVLTTAARRIRIPEGSQLLVVAAGWPSEIVDGVPAWRAGQLAPTGVRPHLRGTIEVIGTAAPGSTKPGGLILNGILLEGTVAVQPGNLGALALAHCTLPPGTSTITTGINPGLALELTRVVCGDLTVGASVRSARLADTIVDGDVTAPELLVEASTVFGSTSASTLHASNSIFAGQVTVARRQEGCVRFCYLPLDSEAPRRYHCQPSDASAATRVRPLFASVRHGDPDYALLAETCPPEIATGADDEGEMGAWHFVRGPQRLRMLQQALDEYLRFGLEAGVFVVWPRRRNGDHASPAPRALPPVARRPRASTARGKPGDTTRTPAPGVRRTTRTSRRTR